MIVGSDVVENVKRNLPMKPNQAFRHHFFANSFVISGLFCCGFLSAQDATTATYKSLPPAGKSPSSDQADVWRGKIDQIAKRLDTVSDHAAANDIHVLTRAVRLAIEKNLFYKAKDFGIADDLLQLATERLERLESIAPEGGEASRPDRLGILGIEDRQLAEPLATVAGFVSHVDDSVQPYGLILPAGWKPDDPTPKRLDVWLHGRGETKLELQFLGERLRSVGPITPADTIVLHPFGRHCNAYKFAGETDVFEAIEDVAKRFSIDPQRISIRGFSMGGAGTWHLAVHHPSRWFAANPGAGFVDTIVYQGWDERPPYSISPAQEKLLAWYDSIAWVDNLRNVQTIAYGGELDKQKNASDRMLQAARESGFKWPYVIGTGMGHKIDADSAKRMDEQLAQWDREPRTTIPEVRFMTYTLRYPTCHWITITGMQRHWTAATIQGEVQQGTVKLNTAGCTHLAIDLPADSLPAGTDAVTILVDGLALAAPDAVAGQPYRCFLQKTSAGWAVASGPDLSQRKQPGLQGPIDDALMDRFIFVRPSRPCWHGNVQRWMGDEYRYALSRWRSVMRGEVREVLDSELNHETIADSNLVLFGDPRANSVLAGIIDKLPIVWTRDELTVNGRSFDVTKHAVVMVFPNPLNPLRYVVLNSGLTFREFSNVSNSRQIAMLPDWAVLDISAGGNALLPGQVQAEGFFDERWEFQP